MSCSPVRARDRFVHLTAKCLIKLSTQKLSAHIRGQPLAQLFVLFLKLPLLSQVAHQPLEAGQAADIEDFGMPARPLQPAILITTKRKRASQGEESQVESQDVELTQSWREILGPPPPMGKTKVSQQLQA